MNRISHENPGERRKLTTESNYCSSEQSLIGQKISESAEAEGLLLSRLTPACALGIADASCPALSGCFGEGEAVLVLFSCKRLRTNCAETPRSVLQKNSDGCIFFFCQVGGKKRLVENF